MGVLLPFLYIGYAFAFQVSIEPNSYSVSGVSSGAFMAVQLEVAYSEFFIGSGIVAGGPYFCASFNLPAAYEICFKHPALENEQWLVAETYSLEALFLIDPLKHLKDHRTLIFSGSSDSLLPPLSSDKLTEQYADFGVNSILRVKNIPAEHGWVTENYGLPCGEFGSPYIMNCGYDLAGNILKQVYGSLKPPTKNDTELIGNIFEFDQKQFKGDSMEEPAFAYIPTACQHGASCKMHICLHGCKMDVKTVGMALPQHSGLNRWGEENNIVIVYPQAKKSDVPEFNPQGCWDWWGYTGPHYAVRDGSQMDAVKRMAEEFHRLNFTG